MPQHSPLTILLNKVDNVAVAVASIEAGTHVPEYKLACRDVIPAGHKMAIALIQKGEPVMRYGNIIGAASEDIEPGDHVHTHNVEISDHKRDYSFGLEATDPEPVPEKDRAYFMGIVRGDGRVATRNYVGVIATVNCSAGVAGFIADYFDSEKMKAFPNVDGVVPVVHGLGCGLADKGEGIETLQRTLAGWARNPNFAGILLVGLGCEVNLVDRMKDVIGVDSGPMFQTIDIQNAGGTKKTVRGGVDAVAEMLEQANLCQRQSVPASHLLVGLECGGSDAFSGITANPALGAAVDLVALQGGTAVLGETTEIYGAEQLLLRRAVNEDVGRKLIDRIHWWEDYTRKNGVVINNNPSPGNKAGGLTTILEKSLGAVAKSGSTNLVDVYRFAESVTGKGLVFMDTPGYDAVSVTGMIAGGANIICFTTGRGSVFGSKPVPTIKLATNSPMYNSMKDDMDINCGLIIDGETTVEEQGEIIFQSILDTASGRKTKSENLGFGDVEFVPWHMGAFL
jgi:altronate hydrolase